MVCVHSCAQATTSGVIVKFVVGGKQYVPPSTIVIIYKVHDIMEIFLVINDLCGLVMPRYFWNVNSLKLYNQPIV